ncbi:hypothetical protein L226DRAFT_536368 [Lentinus tigrinus ALCF2SS1-7]|uniref:Uncharacterized protein n=1 Tax=Lentinus tigrinus ALCF2SS1-6 TaxID=1328759 RepID=A0A5C2S5U3_9APHY|nr:hypothetical protein L227DRAFT_576709 [Lentinus tigrinus ALCF2SS1-6]RPD73244.1 hypothetical protein L226DRAFT_536368 [Lentinus tigrinus ALCF2SS1-7]
MAPRTKRPANSIDKQCPRRQHIILQTLPSVVLSTPTDTITIRFAMSTATANLKQVLPQSPISTPPPASRPPSRSESTGDGKKSPSASIGTFGHRIERGSRGGVGQRAGPDEGVQDAISYLEGHIDDEGASIRQEIQQQVDDLEERMDTKFKEVEEKMDTKFKEVDEKMNTKFKEVDERFKKVDERFDKLEKDMNAKFKEVDEKMNAKFKEVDERFDKLEREVKSMPETIAHMLRQMQQGAQIQVPLIQVTQPPPSSHSHDAASGDSRSSTPGTLETLEFARFSLESSAEGPYSSAQGLTGLTADAGGDDAGLSGGVEGTMRSIVRITSRISLKLKNVTSKRDAAGPSSSRQDLTAEAGDEDDDLGEVKKAIRTIKSLASATLRTVTKGKGSSQ